MDVDVLWEGQVVGRLCNMTMDQPRHGGRWASAGAPAFEEAFRAAQAALGPDDMAMWDAAFISPAPFRTEASRPSPVKMCFKAGWPAPRFRFSG